MNVEATVLRKVQERLRQDLPEGHDHAEVGLYLLHFRHGFRPADPFRLKDRDPVRERADLDRRRYGCLAAADRLVGLRYREHDLMAGGDECLQHRNREVRRTHKNDFHADPPRNKRVRGVSPGPASNHFIS